MSFRAFSEWVIKQVTVLSLCIILAACGGGGGGNNNHDQNSASGIVSSAGGSISLENKASVSVDSNVVKDNTEIFIQTSDKPQVTLPATATAASLSVHIEIPSNSLAENPADGDGFSIVIPVTSSPQAISTQDADDAFKTVAVHISNGTKSVWAFAKYSVATAVDGAKTVGVSIQSAYMLGIKAEGSALMLDTLILNVENCFRGTLLNSGFNTLYQVLPPPLNETASSDMYSDFLSPYFGKQLSVKPDRIPLVLVHGIQLSTDTCTNAYKDTWAHFIASFYNDPELTQKYQLFTYSYDTSKSIRDLDTGEGSGKDFAQALTQVAMYHQAVVVAHSMGGLVARSALTYNSAPINKVLMLGTPNHGTVLRHIDRLLLEGPAKFRQALVLEGAWFLGLEVNGARQLDWDNYDRALDECTLDIDRTCNLFLKNLNSTDGNFQKYTLFAGNITTEPIMKSLYEQLGFPNGESDLVVPVGSALFSEYDDSSNEYFENSELASRNQTFAVTHTGIVDDSYVFFKGRNALLSPAIVSSNISNNAVNIPVNSSISVIFDDDLDASTVNSSTFILDGPDGVVSGSVTYDAGTKTAVFSPIENLAYDTTYTATLSADVHSSQGVPLGSSYTWSFSTDNPVLAVSSTSIPDGATSISINGQISATFTRAIDVSTLTPETLTLTDDNGPVSGEIVFDPIKNVAYFFPRCSLSYGTAYTFTAASNIRGQNGASLADTFAVTFTTTNQIPGGAGKLAWVHDVEHDTEGMTNICAMKMPEGGVIEITHDGFSSAVNMLPNWVPDGTRLAFVREDAATDIYTVNGDGAGVVSLTSNNSASQQDMYPAWSPDGSRIAFWRTEFNGTEHRNNIYLMNADGTDVISLTANGFGDIGDVTPSWSPDGEKIVYVHIEGSSIGPRSNIYMMNTDGANPVRLTNNSYGGPVYIGPQWSPDGTKIVFTRLNYFSPGSSHNTIPSYHFTSSVSNTSNSFGFHYNNDYSSENNISLITSDGQFIDLTNNGIDGPYDYSPVWLPDGKIAFVHDEVSDVAARTNIYTMNPDGSGWSDLTGSDYGGPFELMPSWSLQ